MSGFERRTERKPDQPIVFILGFGGSQKKHLVKYAQIYENQGYEVAVYVSPIVAIRMFDDLWPFAEDFYEQAEFQSEGHRPILFHIMSMVGITTFACFWELLTQKPNGHQIKVQTLGLVFDSGPIPIAVPTSGSKAVSTAKYPPKLQDLYSNFMRSSTYFFVFLYYSYLKMLTIVSTGQRHKICTLYRLEQMTDLPLNQLYLFSKADDVINWEQVEDFIEFQRKRPRAKVWAKCWPDSLHVQHLLKYPKEYERLCVQFSTHLFDGWKSGAKI